MRPDFSRDAFEFTSSLSDIREVEVEDVGVSILPGMTMQQLVRIFQKLMLRFPGFGSGEIAKA